MDKFIATLLILSAKQLMPSWKKPLWEQAPKAATPFYTFPRLDEVLPLPPAKTHWKGIYSAMSKEDAAFYQNPPDTAALAADILKRGIVKKEDVYWPPRKD